MSYGSQLSNGIIKPLSSLLDGLVAYYELDELDVSTAFDANSNLHMASNGAGMTEVTGKVNNCRHSVLSPTLSRNSEPATQVNGNSFTVCAWVNFDATGSSGIVSKWSNTVTEFTLWLNSTQFAMSVSAGNVFHDTITATTGTWYFMCGYWQAGLNSLGIDVNGVIGTPATIAGPSASAAPFIIGGITTTSSLVQGYIDNVGYWRRLLSPSERQMLYNGGRGIKYPFNPQ